MPSTIFCLHCSVHIVQCILSVVRAYTQSDVISLLCESTKVPVSAGRLLAVIARWYRTNLFLGSLKLYIY